MILYSIHLEKKTLYGKDYYNNRMKPWAERKIL